MVLHSHDAVTVFAAVATRLRADCSSMEDRRCNSLVTFFKRFFNLIGSRGHRQKLTHCWHHGTHAHKSARRKCIEELESMCHDRVGWKATGSRCSAREPARRHH